MLKTCIVLLGILVDFTYPSLEEPAPPKLPAQMPLPPIEVDENAELVTGRDEKPRPLNHSALAGPSAPPTAEASPIIQPMPATKTVPQVFFFFLLTLLSFVLIPY